MTKLLLLIIPLAACIVGEDAPGVGSKAVANPTDGDDHVHLSVGKVLTPLHACTGTLISPRVVITAGHCFAAGPDVDDGGPPADAWESEGWSTSVDITLPHPFVNDGENDVALLLLHDPAPFDPAPYSDQPTEIGRELVVSGFGFTGADANDYGTRRSGTMRVADMSPYTISAEAITSATCAGDSGGPAFDDGRIVGVTHRGNCVDRSSFVRFDFHYPWVLDTMTAWFAGGPL